MPGTYFKLSRFFILSSLSLSGRLSSTRTSTDHLFVRGSSKAFSGPHWRKIDLILLNRRITRLEHKVDCADTDTEFSLYQLKRRVEKLEKKNNKDHQTKPKLSTCLRFLLPEAKHWHNIGSLLEISETTLEQIEADYPGDCQQCVREMIKSWLKQVDPPPSWKDLAEAVQIINPCIAKKILNCATTVNAIMKQ